MSETIADIVEAIADALGIYGANESHPDDCTCRVCFAIGLERRINIAFEATPESSPRLREIPGRAGGLIGDLKHGH